MADTGKDHGHSEAVSGGDDVVVADGASRLNDGDGAGFGGFLDAIGEREESVGGDDAAGERRLRFHDGDFYGIDAAHLAGADAERGAIFGENDGVGFDVLADFPREAQSFAFRRAWARAS